MEIIYLLATICLILFMVLATYDGFYLHIFKYGLFNREESYFEHKTHTIRAILFPLIIYFLIIDETSVISFLIGLALVILDLIILAIDSYSEKESRSFMGGLPRWEYIVHLFANGFHFSVIILVLAMKIKITPNGFIFVDQFALTPARELFIFISANVIPGALFLAALHVLLLLERPRSIWNSYRTKVTCC